VSDATSSSLTSELVALRSRAGATLIAATVPASAAGSLNASASQVAIPAIGRSLLDAGHSAVAYDRRRFEA
jgi:hypothetical protein